MSDQVFKTRDQAIAAAKAYRKRGQVLFGCDDPIHAMWGVGVQNPQKNNCSRFLYPRFDAPLEARMSQVTGKQLTSAMRRAKQGLYAQADDPLSMSLRGCVYDLTRGISLVLCCPISSIKLMSGPAGLLWQHEKTGFRVRQVREALGGYSEAKDAEWEALAPLLK